MHHITSSLEIKNYGADGTFSGYASIFDLLDAQNDIVSSGAFKRTIAKWEKQSRMPAMLWMHQPAQPIGVWLGLHEDKMGLAVQGRLALRTQKGMEAYELMRMGAVTGLSIGYKAVAARTDAKRRTRTLLDIDLLEISLVTFPANSAAQVTHVKMPTPTHVAYLTAQISAPLNRAANFLRNA